MNREDWLQRATTLLAEEVFLPAGYTVPAVRVSTGWPSGTKKNGSGTTIGQCWYGHAAADGVAQLFLSPLLADTVDVVATLAHELVHATVGPEAKHGKVFRKCALLIGLEGKMRSTHAGERLTTWIRAKLVPAIGDYPHAQLNPALGPKKQTTRMIKCQCSECGYVARTTAKWIAAIGAPMCACNGEQMEVSQ
jgi:hypothetical protein